MIASLIVYARPLLGVHFRVTGKEQVVQLQKQWASPEARVAHPLALIVKVSRVS